MTGGYLGEVCYEGGVIKRRRHCAILATLYVGLAPSQFGRKKPLWTKNAALPQTHSRPSSHLKQKKRSAIKQDGLPRRREACRAPTWLISCRYLYCLSESPILAICKKKAEKQKIYATNKEKKSVEARGGRRCNSRYAGDGCCCCRKPCPGRRRDDRERAALLTHAPHFPRVE